MPKHLPAVRKPSKALPRKDIRDLQVGDDTLSYGVVVKRLRSKHNHALMFVFSSNHVQVVSETTRPFMLALRRRV
jgi:hypothetical protein